MSTCSIEIIYRGILQMTLARRIGRGSVLAARKEGKLGFTFGRYGDSPERVGIPAKQFAVIGDSEKDLQPFMTPYELADNDVTAVLDDTLCKGVQSWGWQNIQPINRLTKAGGTLIVLSEMSADDLLKIIPAKKAAYNLAIVKGSPNWSTIWKYEDDTDARILGAIARVAPHIISLDSAEYVITEKWGQASRVKLARKSYDEVLIRPVAAGEGARFVPAETKLPKWQDMTEAIAVPAVPSQAEVKKGAYKASRNPHYKNLTSRTNRPVVDFSKCRKCSLCWLQCPEGAFDIMPDGTYNASFEYCNGCGICATICPVEGCITMAPERRFADNAQQ